MIVEETKESIFTVPCQTITNPINMVGVMGRGLALEYKNRFPKIMEPYKKACREKVFHEGKLITVPISDDKQVLLFPTKYHWRDSSTLFLIERGLQYLQENYQELNIETLALPRIGCGLGGLDYQDVKLMINKYLQPIDIKVTLCI